MSPGWRGFSTQYWTVLPCGTSVASPGARKVTLTFRRPSSLPSKRAPIASLMTMRAPSHPRT